MKRMAVVCALAVALALGACGYFNTLYNANRQFNDAERARLRGDLAAARVAYVSSIDRAAKSYRKYPHGRWSNDALYLIGRARFRLNEDQSARAAFAELLARDISPDVRAAAHAFSGAAALRLSAEAAALAQLDSAITQLKSGSELYGFARLWRARARMQTGDLAGAWSDLDAVDNRNDREFQAIQIERVALAISAADTARAASAFSRLLNSHELRRQMDTVTALALAASGRFGAERARTMLGASAQAEWAPPVRDSLMLLRAMLALRAGDTLNAHRELLDLAGRSAANTSNAARVSVARSRLHGAARLEQLADVRTLLLPAISNPDAQNLVRSIRLVDVLVRRSTETGQPLTLFAAAEIARDELGAPQLARQLFVTFADVAANTPWAGKALLAAIALAPGAPESNALRDRLNTLPANPYTSAVRGEDALAEYETAEARLDRSLAALKEEAAQLAQRQEGAVTRMVFVLDSVRLAARADTVRARCGIMIDTLAIAGIRADSVRAACLRGDAELLTAYLSIDTLRWKPGAQQDTGILKRRRPSTAKKDTVIR